MLRGSLLNPDGDISRIQYRFLLISLVALRHGSNFFLIDLESGTLVSIQMPFWWFSAAGSESSLLPLQVRNDPFTGEHLHDSAEDHQLIEMFAHLGKFLDMATSSVRLKK